ncbi:ADP-ribosylglycohydrolase family protein [Undibacterium sp. Ji42W]|uniref:ADP-ribosylglycohydrolase family protein n=1 Tax=Undibacterium sp. Ji42W TaxID=3413039 RepID=UPI003BF3BA6C
MEDFEKAMWLTVSAGGDRDTLCAIAGAVVASFVGYKGIPDSWRARLEALPDWYLESRDAN